MRKTSRIEIQWYEPDDNRRRPTATLKNSGVLCFGAQMREELSNGKIRIGLDAGENAIVVKANSEHGSTLSKNGEVNLSLMAKSFRRLGIRLPATFLFFHETSDSIWKGYIVLPPRNAAAKALSDECVSIIAAYKWLIDKVVYTSAKTTPIEERRAIATAALWEAMRGYTQNHGVLIEHLCDELKLALLRQNKHYVKESPYRHISLDAPTEAYELLLLRCKNEMLSVENRLHLDAFRKEYLNECERRILKRLLDGFAADEIQLEFNMAEDELFECCEDIGRRWKTYNSDDLT